jgi:hypothetical protein
LLLSCGAPLRFAMLLRVIGDAFHAPAEKLRSRGEARHRVQHIVKDRHRLHEPVLLIQGVGEMHLKVRFRGVQADRAAKPPLCDNVRAHLQKVCSDMIFRKAGGQNRLR